MEIKKNNRQPPSKQGRNPFITGSPVRRQDFFGRKQLLEDISRFLLKSGEVSLVIYGQRRMGKTSLLRKIQEDAASGGLAYPLYFNVQDSADLPLNRVLSEIANRINGDLDLGLEIQKEYFDHFPSSHEASQYFQKVFIPSVIPKLTGNRYLLLIFDEFDVMGTVKDDDIDDGSGGLKEELAYKRFIPFLDRWIEDIQHNEYPVKIIFSIGREYKYLENKRFRQITKYGPQLEISFFTKTETKQFLESVSHQYIPFEPDALDAVYSITSGHPYFTQCLAGVCFDAAQKDKKNRVTPAVVIGQFANAVDRYSSGVYWVWDSLSPGAQVILYVMARLSEENRPVTPDNIRERAYTLNAGAAVENLFQTLDRLKSTRFIKDSEHIKGEFEFFVEFLRKWIVNKVPEPEILQKSSFLSMLTQKKGVLFLADIVDYTDKANALGSNKTMAFNKNYEKQIRRLTKKHRGVFIRRIGDGVLIFFADEKQFLEFSVELRSLSINRILDYEDFFAELRIAAHYGNFSFEEISNKINDLIGPEGITVFRIEKYANKHDVLITEFLLSIVKNLLIKENIRFTKLGREKLKGFDEEVTLYKLIFPEKEDIDASNLLWVKMAELEADTKEIPVFGDLYPPMSMEDNFINLDIKTGLTEEENLLEKEEFDADELMGVAGKREKEFYKGKRQRLPYLGVKELYEKQYKGIILGLPGSGKTTILKYFAYREFKHNRELQTDEKQRFVLFIPCGNIMSYTRWYRQLFPKEKESDIAFNIETILNYFTHCFLFKREEKDKKDETDIRRAEKLVHQAYHQGRLTILIDALDEAPDKDVKEKIIASIKTLLLESTEGKQKNNRVYLTSRYSERETYFCGKNAEVLQPVFEVRPLDMEQLREMAEYFYIGKPKLFKAFDEVVWKEEIAAKVGGTPLTALLVIAYFEIFRKFDTRYFMYNVIVIFILIRVWKQVKEKSFDMDMRTFFRGARSKRVLTEQKSSKEIYDALTLLSYEHMDEGRVIKEGDIIGTFETFAKLAAGEKSAEEDAEQWLEQMKEDHLLVSAGAGEYVFMHSTVMEYLAARYIVEKFNDPFYLEKIFENKDYIAHLAQKGPMFFQSEILSIAVGSGIKNGTRVLQFIKNCIRETNDEEEKNRFYNLALKSLAEFESFIDRQYQEKRLKYLHKDMEKEIAENRDAVEWVYQYLKEIILGADTSKLSQCKEWFQNISRLTRPDFLEKYLDYETFSEGGSEIVTLREELLKKVMDEELLETWLQKHGKEKDREFLEAEKEQIEKAGGSVLTLDSKEYNPEDKNFRYYREYSGKELMGFLGSPNFKHEGGINCVAFSPDGKYIVSGSDDQTLKLWERATGKGVRTFKGHKGLVKSVCFSPEGEGKYILSGSHDKTLKLWDRTTGKEVRTFKGHEGYVMSVCFSPEGEGKYILSGSYDKTLKLWDRTTGKELRTFKGHNGRVLSVCFSPEGNDNYILSGSLDHTLKLWETATGKEIRTFKGHKDRVKSVCFSPEGTGKYILSGSSDDTVKLWDRSSGKEVRTFKGHSRAINSVCFSPEGEGKYILSGSSDQTVKLWERATGKEVRTFKGHSDYVRSVCFSPEGEGEGKYILSGSWDQMVKLWERATGKELRTFKGHNGYVLSVCFSPEGEGKYILSGSSDYTLKLWETATGKEVRTFKGHKGRVWSVCFSPDGEGKYILSGSSDHTLKLWETATGKEVRTFKGHNGYVLSVCFSPEGEGKYILSGSSDYTLKLWETATGKEVRTFKGHKGRVWSVCFSPDGEGKYILSGSSDHTLKLWETATGKEVRIFKGHSRAINSVCFSPEGTGKCNYILSGSSDKTVKLWDRSSGKEVRTFKGHERGVNSVCFSPDGTHILSGSSDHTMKLWDRETGACLKTIPLLWVPCEIKAHPSKLGLFATANMNGTVTFFDFREIIR